MESQAELRPEPGPPGTLVRGSFLFSMTAMNCRCEYTEAGSLKKEAWGQGHSATVCDRRGLGSNPREPGPLDKTLCHLSACTGLSAWQPGGGKRQLHVRPLLLR